MTIVKTRKTLKKKSNNIEQLGNVIDKSSKLNNSMEAMNMLYHFFQNNMNSEEFPELLKNTVFFSEEKMGKSGAKVSFSEIAILSFNNDCKITRWDEIVYTKQGHSTLENIRVSD